MSAETYKRIFDFLTREMRQSHIYQPVMIRTLLEKAGVASSEEIARAFLAEDRSQLEYYEEIVGRMPGPVLARRGIVEKQGKSYRLTNDARTLTDAERESLIQLCNEKLASYLENRPDPWGHRRKNAGYVPGSLRYRVLERAGTRCEACGVSAEERALEVDHIIPLNDGGTNDESNLQALCYRCNAQKRDRGSLNFGAVRASYADRDPGCPFCHVSRPVIAENALAIALYDDHPVTEGHTLVFPKRHIADFFGLYAPERNAMHVLLDEQRTALRSSDKAIAGFKVGVNCGEAAGQTIFHVHLHLIPRRVGDAPDPRGGVRGVIPERQKYEPV